MKQGAGLLGVVLIGGALIACQTSGESTERTRLPVTPSNPETGTPLPDLDWRLVAEYEHDPLAFTQGLLWHEGRLYESLGNYGRSTVRRWELETGLVEAESPLAEEYFGEGLVVAGGELVQLTWREGTALRWSVPDLERVGSWSYSGEGWGLAWDGAAFVQSDGSARLVWRDAESFEVTRELEVSEGGRPVSGLNELEWVDGRLWANVWGATDIVRIDPESGRIDGVLRLAGLLPTDELSRVDVMNGIAFRAETGTFLVTGKYWPRLFEIEIVD